MAQVLNNR